MTVDGVVLVHVDGSEASHAALDVAAEEATARRGRLKIVCCWEIPALPYLDGHAPPPGYEEALAGGADAVLQAAVEHVETRFPQLEVDRVLLHGQPDATLADISRGADLLVLGTRPRWWPASQLRSRHVELSNLAWCPIRVVGAERPRRRPSRH